MAERIKALRKAPVVQQVIVEAPSPTEADIKIASLRLSVAALEDAVDEVASRVPEIRVTKVIQAPIGTPADSMSEQDVAAAISGNPSVTKLLADVAALDKEFKALKKRRPEPAVYGGGIGTAQGLAPAGGLANYVLKKNTGVDYDYSWQVDATGGGGGGGTWGSITGTLSDQTDLQTALNAKAAASHTHEFSDLLDVFHIGESRSSFLSNVNEPAIYQTDGTGSPNPLDFPGHLILQARTAAGGSRDVILAAGPGTPQALVRVGNPFGTPYVWLPVNNTRLEFGSGANVQMYSDGVNFFFENTTGACYFISSNACRFLTTTAQSVEFYTNSTFAWGFEGSGGHLYNIADNREIRLGASNDLRLYHDGTNSFIQNDTGALGIKQSSTEVARFDTSATAGDTRFMIYDVDNGTLERVTVGAADSGGAGFKVLRIPN